VISAAVETVTGPMNAEISFKTLDYEFSTLFCHHLKPSFASSIENAQFLTDAFVHVCLTLRRSVALSLGIKTPSPINHSLLKVR